jgi:hypothetical protein
MRIFTGLGEIRDAVGEHLGYSDYQVITQADIDAFAALTGDDQWIHTDQERAANGPFGGTIAHGLLTLQGPRRGHPRLGDGRSRRVAGRHHLRVGGRRPGQAGLRRRDADPLPGAVVSGVLS